MAVVMKSTVSAAVSVAVSAAVAVAVASLAGATPAAAEIIVTPYFLLPTSNGKLGVGPVDVNIDSTPADLFRDLRWAVLGSVEWNNGDWGVNFDVNYISLNVAEGVNLGFEVRGHQAAYTATVLKRIHPFAWVYAGARYSDFGVRLLCDLDCGVPQLPPRDIDVRRSRGWVEPVVGFRAELPFNDKLDLTVNADMGGFGAGSNISANFWPQLGIRVGSSGKALLGYRIIYVDYDSDEGDRRFVYDAATFGPTLGFEWRF